MTAIRAIRIEYRIFIRYACASASASFATAAASCRGATLMNQAPKYGDLRIEECLDEDLRRYVRTARLFDEANVLPSKALPELLDVRLLAMSPQAFTLTGLERAGGVEYAQSWLVSDRHPDVIRRNRTITGAQQSNSHSG